MSEAPKDVELNMKALTLARSLGDTWRQAQAFAFLGWTDSHDFKRRVDYWEKAIALFRKVGDLRFLAGLLGSLGFFLALNGNIDSAQKCLDESSLLLQQLNPQNFVWHNNLGGYIQLAMIRRDYEQARALSKELQNLSQENGDRLTYLWTQVRLAYIDLREGKISEAHHTFSEIAQSFQNNGNTIGVVFTLEGMAGLSITLGEPERAARLIGWADATRKKIQDTRPRLEQEDVDKIIAACIAARGETSFTESYDEGQKMSLEEAVSYALEKS
jgi:tetratricopeptide (TPR) repeat protein